MSEAVIPEPGSPPAPPALPALSIYTSALTKYYGEVCAVDRLSLSVYEGEFFGFLGPNGAGKSTTIRMMCGLLRPDAGAVTVAGVDVVRLPIAVKASVGVLPEDPALYDRLSGEEFLLFAGRMYGLPYSEARRRAQDLLELMELSDARGKWIIDYSMGMKKKVALAAAMIHRPRVLFLDEPFNGIDPVSVRAIRSVMRHLTQNGTTIFISSHVMEVVEKLCSRVAIITQGRLVAVGTLAELRSLANAESDSSLEDVFLKLVDARVEDEVLSWL